MTGPFPGQIGSTDYSSEANAHAFAIRQHLARVRTAVDVIVKAVHAGAQPDQWTVDVQLLVNMVDGVGNPTAHGIIFGIPVFTISGANGSLCVQPTAGDLGVMLICDRDHSSAIANKGVANPGSDRVHDLADGIYLGGFGAMNSNSQRIVMTTSGIKVTGNVDVTGTLTVTQEIVAMSGGANIHLSTHKHTDPQGGTTGSPITGS